jgi:ADP-ribosyl-[dinitrogen reductase] hydrolase
LQLACGLGKFGDNHPPMKIAKIINRPGRNPIRDGILGLVTGDALGVPVEFCSREDLKGNPVRDMIGHGTYNLPPGTWSDDSSLALCLAEELTEGYDVKRIGNSFVRWLYENHWTPYGKVFDVGISTKRALERLRNGAEPNLAGNRDESSNGNGSLMRILPLLFHIRPMESADERFNLIREVSGITHAHMRSCLACCYYLEMAQALCKDEDIQRAYEQTNVSFMKLTEEMHISHHETEKFRRLLDGHIAELSEKDIRSSGYVMDTLEASVWCVLTEGSYKEAVLKAVNLGQDTDTTGAVTGGLAGLIYGAESIPKDWLSKIARMEDIENLIRKMTEKFEY